MFNSSLANLMKIRNCKRKRLSSYDRMGGNADYVKIQPGEIREFGHIDEPGIVRHIWMTLGCSADKEPAYPRRIVLRMYWDDEENPSVEAPIGDFFGIGHGILKNFVSLPLQMSPQEGKGMNCWFPMPFYKNARFSLENNCQSELVFYFYIDYEAYAELEPGLGQFHAWWNRENPTEGWGEDGDPQIPEVWKVPNLDGKENYLILEAEGKGQYVGCNLNVDCFRRRKLDWYGEGDDMIFIDGEPWPPRLHGTGTEDYFNTAYSPREEYNAPYHGVTVYSGTPDWPYKGKNSLYRFHIEDPIQFEKSIRVTIEHGHANNLSHDYSSTAYWYQIEPHKPFRPLPPVEKRLPRPEAR